ncbi:MAG: flagellar hook-length control protein FliK [Hyphomonas sp.]|nr:flagellar hook-length control protein FliK [Hyphomonas sp.]
MAISFEAEFLTLQTGPLPDARNSGAGMAGAGVEFAQSLEMLVAGEPLPAAFARLPGPGTGRTSAEAILANLPRDMPELSLESSPGEATPEGAALAHTLSPDERFGLRREAITLPSSTPPLQAGPAIETVPTEAGIAPSTETGTAAADGTPALMIAPVPEDAADVDDLPSEASSPSSKPPAATDVAQDARPEAPLRKPDATPPQPADRAPDAPARGPLQQAEVPSPAEQASAVASPVAAQNHATDRAPAPDLTRAAAPADTTAPAVQAASTARLLEGSGPVAPVRDAGIAPDAPILADTDAAEPAPEADMALEAGIFVGTHPANTDRPIAHKRPESGDIAALRADVSDIPSDGPPAAAPASPATGAAQAASASARSSAASGVQPARSAALSDTPAVDPQTPKIRTKMADTAEAQSDAMPAGSEHKVTHAATTSATSLTAGATTPADPAQPASPLVQAAIPAAPAAPSPAAQPIPAGMTQAHALVSATPAEVVSLISDNLASPDDRQDRITVQLDPPELGRVSIDFRFNAHGLQHVTITGDNPEALRQLRLMHFDLVQTLERNGLSGESMSFQQNTGHTGQDGQPPAPSRAWAGTRFDAQSNEPEPSTTPSRQAARTGSGLDMRL